jgi:hypothetical protein
MSIYFSLKSTAQTFSQVCSFNPVLRLWKSNERYNSRVTKRTQAEAMAWLEPWFTLSSCQITVFGETSMRPLRHSTLQNVWPKVVIQRMLLSIALITHFYSHPTQIGLPFKISCCWPIHLPSFFSLQPIFSVDQQVTKFLLTLICLTCQLPPSLHVLLL